MTVVRAPSEIDHLRDELIEALDGLEPVDRAIMERLLVSQIFDPVAAFYYLEDRSSAALYLWPLTPVDIDRGGAFLHLFQRPIAQEVFHSHLADSRSQILSGSYVERWRPLAWSAEGEVTRQWRAGDVIERKADEGHQLSLPDGCPYVLTRYTVGPRIRQETFTEDEMWLPRERIAGEIR